MDIDKRVDNDMTVKKTEEKTTRRQLIRKIAKQISKENEEGFRRLSRN